MKGWVLKGLNIGNAIVVSKSMMKAFVIMPFGNDVANDVYKLCTKPICDEFDLEVYRADEIFTTNPIIDDITAEIDRANVIIADISGKNANVFYELGMAHLLKRKQIIMITQDDFENIPFDIAHFRIIKYDNTIVGKSAYENQLRQTLRSILQDYGLIYREDFDTTFNITIENTGKKTASDVYIHVKTKGVELKNSVFPHDGFFSPKDDILQQSEQANVIFNISATEYNPYQEYSIEIYSNCHQGSHKKIFDGTFIYSEDYNYWYLVY